MKLIIYRAADAFLYLPTYLAEEYGIFDTLLKGLGIKEIEFITSDGDIESIVDMHKANLETETISIAICDPTAFLSLRVREEQSFKKADIKVIGAVINKLAFWAVNHTKQTFNTIEDFKNEFTKVIHYKDELITGYYLGNKVKNMSNIHNCVAVDFGTEIDILEEVEVDNPKKVAITADIVSVAKGISRTENPLTINYRFSKPENPHLTTGILTTTGCCENHKEILSKIIEGVQKSILIIYSSNNIAEKICETISKKPEFNNVDIDYKVISKIIELINEDKFYPADLNISEAGWNEALNALASTHQWNESTRKELLSTSFNKYVDNSFVLSAEKSLANQLGINDETFEFNKKFDAKLKAINEENKQLKEKAKYYVPWLSVLSKALFNLFKLLKKYIRIIIFIIFIISSILIYKFYLNDQITLKDVFLTVVIGLIIAVFGAYFYDLIKSKK